MIGQLGRTMLRSVLMFLSLAQIALGFLVLRLRTRGPIPPPRRAHWLRWSCALLLKRLGIRVQANGPLPSAGLIVSNHLGYLDILVFGATLPCIFVSKAEVRSWPVFGLLVQFAGTIFLDRRSQSSAAEVTRQIGERLQGGLPILLFPEGTSTDGTALLRFHSSLLEAAIRTSSPIAAAAVSYTAADTKERDLCYYGDDTFLPHLLRTLGRREVFASVRFSGHSLVYPDRKVAASSLWSEVAQLRAELRTPSPLGSTRPSEVISYSSP